MLITPELVHPLDKGECPPLPGGDVFEPGDLEFYLLGRLESRRPYDFRSPVRTDLSRNARYRHCEQMFIFGPQGYSDGKPLGQVSDLSHRKDRSETCPTARAFWN